MHFTPIFFKFEWYFSMYFNFFLSLHSVSFLSFICSNFLYKRPEWEWPPDYIFSYLGSSWWNFLKELCNWNWALRFQKPRAFDINSLPHAFGPRWKLPGTAQDHASLPVTMFSAIMNMNSSSKTVNPPINSFFYKLLWSWYFIIKLKK